MQAANLSEACTCDESSRYTERVRLHSGNRGSFELPNSSFAERMFSTQLPNPRTQAQVYTVRVRFDSSSFTARPGAAFTAFTVHFDSGATVQVKPSLLLACP